MIDFLDSLPLLLIPFQLVLTQSLLVVVAIALESLVIHRGLKYPPRKSVEYAISLNFFSLFIGWFFFLTLIGSFPLPLVIKQDIINLILFDQWSTSTLAWTMTIGIVTFFGTLFVESVGIYYLRQLRKEEKPTEEVIIEKQKSSRRYGNNRPQFFNLGDGSDDDPIYVLLLANATSYSAITAILLLLQFGSTLFPLNP